MSKTIVVKANETHQLETTAFLDSLTVEEGASIAAPEGKVVSMTVGGVERPIAPGTYEDVVLTITEGFAPEGGAMFGPSIKDYRVALYVDESGINSLRSVVSALQGGTYDEKGMTGVSIKSENNLFGGILIDGGKYEIKDLNVELNGYGGDDFSGKGTALVVSGDADVTVDGLKVLNKGVIRSAVLVTGDANVTVKNSEIVAYGGSDDEQRQVSSVIRGMTGVPWVLGLSGNNRATNLLTRGTVTYENSSIKAERWGALSTDGPAAPEKYGEFSITLLTKNCEVEVFGESGYGSYAIGAGHNIFENTTFKVPDYALVIANEFASADFIAGTKVSSKRFGVLWHQNQGGLLKLKEATFNTEMSTFLLKGCYPRIEVEKSVLNAKNGVILQLMDSDDPGLGKNEVAVDNVTVQKVSGHDVTKANYHDLIMFNTINLENYCTDAQASFKDMAINGDFYNATTNAIAVGSVSDPNQEMPPMPEPGGPGPGDGDFAPPEMKSTPSTCYPINLILSFEKVDLTGVISAATAKHNVKTITKACLIELGQVANTPCKAVNNGVVASFDKDSKWVVAGNSYLTGLNLEDGAIVAAPAGKSVVMTVNGVNTPITAGSYSGDIVVSVS